MVFTSPGALRGRQERTRRATWRGFLEQQNTMGSEKNMVDYTEDHGDFKNVMETRVDLMEVNDQPWDCGISSFQTNPYIFFDI